MNKFTLAITTYNRPDETVEAFHTVIGHSALESILIEDDCSNPESQFKLKDNLQKLGFKYKGDFMNIVSFELFEHVGKGFKQQPPDFFLPLHYIYNHDNIGMSRNKASAVLNSNKDFVILFDSDNQLSHEYLDALSNIMLNKRTIYMPSFAREHFDYRKYIGKLDLQTVQENHDDPIMKCLMNTCNYVVPKDMYCKVYEQNKDVHESDTLWFNYLWLKAGLQFEVVPGMEYEHKVHDGSAWLQNAKKNEEVAKEIWHKILQL